MFNERLKEKRLLKELTQVALAQKVGITRDLYNKYERAGIRPSHETLVLLAQELDTTTDYLLGVSDDQTPSGERLSIPEELKDLQVAFHRGEFEGLNQDEVNKLAEYAKFIKSQREAMSDK